MLLYFQNYVTLHYAIWPDILLTFPAEFLLLNKEGTDLGDWRDMQQAMSLQEPLAVMRTAPMMQKILDYMEQLGWEPYEVSAAHNHMK